MLGEALCPGVPSPFPGGGCRPAGAPLCCSHCPELLCPLTRLPAASGFPVLPCTALCLALLAGLGLQSSPTCGRGCAFPVLARFWESDTLCTKLRSPVRAAHFTWGLHTSLQGTGITFVLTF